MQMDSASERRPEINSRLAARPAQDPLGYTWRSGQASPCLRRAVLLQPSLGALQPLRVVVSTDSARAATPQRIDRGRIVWMTAAATPQAGGWVQAVGSPSLCATVGSQAAPGLPSGPPAGPRSPVPSAARSAKSGVEQTPPNTARAQKGSSAAAAGPSASFVPC